MRSAGGLEYEARGDGEAVLLIHGGCVADAFLPMSRETALDRGYRVIWYRRRGYGASGPLTTPFRVADQARDAATLLRHLGVSRADVVGHSFGGAVAVRLALDAPDLVHSLVLLEPAVFTREEADRIDWIGALTDVYRAGEIGKAVHLFMRTSGRNWRAEVEANIPGAGAQAESDARGLIEGDIAAVLDSTYGADDASAITQPVLYLRGSESGHQGEAVTHLIATDVEEDVIPGVTHLLHMVAPGPVASITAEFLDRHPLP